MGFLLEGLDFVAEGLCSRLLLNAELVPGTDNVKAWSTGICFIGILRIITMGSVEIRKEHPPSDSWLGWILALLRRGNVVSL